MPESTNSDLDRTIGFIRHIGLDVVEGRPNDEPAFNPDSYVWMHQGTLYVDRAKSHYGDLLHEAGHLAVLPSFARERATGDVDESCGPLIRVWMEENGDKLLQWPEDPIARACIQCGDHEAIAWSYAAAVAIGVEPYACFENGFPDEEARTSAWMGCQMKQFMGINGLRAGGFFQRVKDYPQMEKWLAP